MIQFSKAHAYGNDFLYVPENEVAGADLRALAIEMCDRNRGIGADGLILYTVVSGGASMKLFNADGGPSEVSGNGVRGLGAILLRDDTSEQASVTIQTGAGPKHLARVERSDSRQTFRAEMGKPSGLRRTSIPVAGETVEAVVLSIGNPQCILLEPLPDDARFNRLGPALEKHAMFPEGTNVEFAHVEAPARVRIRIWERGCGPTQSSGTGSCASLVAAAAFGGAARDAQVIAPGGEQRVEWASDDRVFLTGWAEIVCDGHWLRQIPRTS